MVNLRRQQGFTYLIALFMVAILSIVTLRALENSLTKDRRDKEVELLYVGQAYQQAIMSYYNNSPGSANNTYPPSLAALTLPDTRTTTLRQPLRRLYFDPITASQDWGTIPDSNGNIMGVYSKSTQKPIKVNGFPAALCSFNGATSYQSWQFAFPPNACQQVQQSQQNPQNQPN
jgi:type II secretory pathway pseudopilin PulG